MTWKILWAAGARVPPVRLVQAVVSKREMMRLLPDDSPRTLAISCGLRGGLVVVFVHGRRAGPADLPQGGDFTAAMAFEFASAAKSSSVSLTSNTCTRRIIASLCRRAPAGGSFQRQPP
jgi:hypothetical protein